MGLLSGLFGKKKAGGALQEAMQQVQRLLEDEEYQLSLVHPVMRELISTKPAYDRVPNGVGPFGFAESNPIPTNGPIGELAYLSRLETTGGERIIFHRLGSIDTIDVFEAVTFSGSEWFIMFADFYHPRKSQMTPDGFRFMDGLGQFSGFNKFAKDFPYDFVPMKHAERESGLVMAYIAINKVQKQIDAKSFVRPKSHQAKLDSVKTKLTSLAG